MPIQDRRVKVVVGDVLDPQCVSEAVVNQDAIIVALGSHGENDRNVRSNGTTNIIRAMKANGVRRLIVLSAGGVGDSYQKASFVLKALINTILKDTYTDHEEQVLSF